MGAYMFFAQERRGDVRAAHPDLTMIEIGRMLGEEWRALSAGDKARFEEKAKADAERYRREMAAFKTTQGDEGELDEEDYVLPCATSVATAVHAAGCGRWRVARNPRNQHSWQGCKLPRSRARASALLEVAPERLDWDDATPATLQGEMVSLDPTSLR
eukprot:scaffold1007_cov364-Prasinococcus_capsulatus_cf.AAC.1